MPSLPSASTRLSSQSGTAPVSTDLLAVFAACRLLADGVPRLYSSVSALLDAHDYCEGAEEAALHMQDVDKPVLFVPLPIVTAGAIVRTETVHTGTCKVSVAASANGILAEVNALMRVTRGGTIGTDQILLELSLDGGTSYSAVRLGTASSYAIPRIGITVSFGAGTLVTGDTILKFKTSAPLFDSAGVTLGKEKMIIQQRQVRSWLFVGDVPTLALGQAIETAVNAYETAAERYVYAKFQARDWRRLESSRERLAMVGGPAITFAEVGATGDTITRGTGSFVTDGVQVGDWVAITGSASNNVSGKVTAVTATVLTLDTTDLAPEVAVAGAVRITAEPAYTIAAATITRNRGSWIAEGFAVGDVFTLAGTASNNWTGTITGLTATVITFTTGNVVVNETIGSCTASVTLTESETAWMAAVASTFANISSSKRVDIGAGRLTKLSPILGYTMRRPVQWADSIRSYQNDVHITTWEKDLNALTGWGIENEHDERVNQGLLGDRFTCARTWGNGPEGAFIAMSVTRAVDGDRLGMTHNMAVANVAQTVCQRTTETFAGRTLVLNADGTATKSSLADLETRVNAELQTNLMANVTGDGQRASFAKWTAAINDNLSIANAALNGTLELKLRGTIVTIATKVEVS